MIDKKFEYLQSLLTNLWEWELIWVHSYLRNSPPNKKMHLNDVFFVSDKKEDIEISVDELTKYVQIEYQKRNLN